MVKTEKEKGEKNNVRHGVMFGFCPVCNYILVEPYPVEASACCGLRVSLRESYTTITIRSGRK